MNQPRIHSKWYIVADVIVALATWIMFYYLRTLIYHSPFKLPGGFYSGAFAYTVGWVSLHFLSGAYDGIYQKTTITEFFRTAIVSLIGSFLLLFFFILKNPQSNNANYYKEYFALLVPVFFLTIISRLIFLDVIKKQLAAHKVFFKVMLIGAGKNALTLYDAFTVSNQKSGYAITGFLNTNGNGVHLPEHIKRYSNLDQLAEVIATEKIEEVIITVEKQERELLTKILQQLSDKDVNIKITPDAVDIITGAVQTSNVMGVPLIDVHGGVLSSWQKNVKRFVDLVFSLIALVGLSPLILYAAIRTMLSSRGPVLYFQERIGYKGIPFTIYKFRSMVQDAEKEAPALSSQDDPRITKWGKVMRKWRLDELPQLINILKGEMSLVGPRPERKFYVDQIVQQHPEYNYLFKVKPGLSSWGMVKFGYASSVDEMIQRMPYDLMYVENVSLLLDARIMILTLVTLLRAEGK